MKTAKLKLYFHLLASAILTATLLLPGLARAVGIGEIVLQSRLGEPLLAQVDLVLAEGEHIEDSCLSLVAPDPSEEDPGSFLLRVSLALKAEGTRRYVDIRSRKPLNDVFARLRLQVKCPGSGIVIKTLTILPDIELTVPDAPVVAPADEENTLPPPPANAHANVQPDTQSSRPEVERSLSVSTKPPTHKRRSSSARASANNAGHSAAFRLKLSGEPIDESRIGKISAEERTALLARQQLLDADDQMASFLALQNQVKQLQSELGAIKLQLSQAGAIPAAVTPAPSVSPQAAPATNAPGAQEKRPKPASAAKPPTAQQDNFDLRDGLFAAFALVLVILILWLGLRYYTKAKSRRHDEPIVAQKLVVATAEVAPPPVTKSPSPAPPVQAGGDQAPVVAEPPKASIVSRPSVSPPPPAKVVEETSEEDSMLEEAELYAAHGRPAKAVEILQEIVKRKPEKAEAWPLLLSIYSALGKATEFEKTAREFLRHHKDSPAWSGIQALGRTFDQNNPLYADNNSRIAASSLLPQSLTLQRPIGDVLMEMGVLSKQDLQNCLDDFDPKKHGRFGGYLVSRKAITLAQLDQALLQQQGVVAEAKPGALPSLQDLENFLADFDPARDGSVGEFLASRNAVTPEQLSKLLQGQSSAEVEAEAPQAEEPPPFDKGFALEFDLAPSLKSPLPDLEFEPATAKEKPADTKVESIDFPEIDLNLGSDNPQGRKAGE